MAKLTLSVNDDVIAKAKQFAGRQGVSVSRLVETYLDSVSARDASADFGQPTPVLRSLRGIIRPPKASKDARIDTRRVYRQYLSEKYSR